MGMVGNIRHMLFSLMMNHIISYTTATFLYVFLTAVRLIEAAAQSGEFFKKPYVGINICKSVKKEKKNS